MTTGTRDNDSNDMRTQRSAYWAVWNAECAFRKSNLVPWDMLPLRSKRTFEHCARILAKLQVHVDGRIIYDVYTLGGRVKLTPHARAYLVDQTGKPSVAMSLIKLQPVNPVCTDDTVV